MDFPEEGTFMRASMNRILLGGPRVGEDLSFRSRIACKGTKLSKCLHAWGM